jgi:NADPH:quinone reductase-like Zn-dependent oxidoreductase
MARSESGASSTTQHLDANGDGQAGGAMRAVVFDRPAPDAGATRVAELPVPEPGPGQIAVEVACAGINFIDVMARRGDPGYAPEWPFVPGLEIAGTVRALGPGVEEPPPGTRVAAFVGRGGLAEVALASAALVARVPEAVDLARAAAARGAPPTAALLLEHVARVRAGEVVLVHSAGGGVGHALAQLAPLTGRADRRDGRAPAARRRSPRGRLRRGAGPRRQPRAGATGRDPGGAGRK